MTHTNHATKIRNFDEINWGIPFFCLFHPYNIKNVGKSGHIIPILVLLGRSIPSDKQQMMLQMDMCERRGSGIDRATDAISQMKLPAYKAQSGDDYTRITLFPKKKVSEMTREERIAICYQHACLLYEDGKSINNQIVRERFNLNKNTVCICNFGMVNYYIFPYSVFTIHKPLLSLPSRFKTPCFCKAERSRSMVR